MARELNEPEPTLGLTSFSRAIYAAAEKASTERHRLECHWKKPPFKLGNQLVNKHGLGQKPGRESEGSENVTEEQRMRQLTTPGIDGTGDR